MISNLGYLTDSFFLENDIIIKDFNHFTLVKSPTQPKFYYGNYFFLHKPIHHYSKLDLEKKFSDHFHHKEKNHFTFCWSGEDVTGVKSYLEDGYELEEISVMKAKKNDIIPFNSNIKEYDIKKIISSYQWSEWVDFECDERPKDFSEEGFKKFILGRAEVYQKLKEQNKGDFYGVYFDQQLIASAGLFHEKGIGRFQSVKTSKHHRNKGICKNLIYYMANLNFKFLDTLVITADKGYFALKIYEKLGFVPTDSQTSVCWWKK